MCGIFPQRVRGPWVAAPLQVLEGHPLSRSPWFRGVRESKVKFAFVVMLCETRIVALISKHTYTSPMVFLSYINLRGDLYNYHFGIHYRGILAFGVNFIFNSTCILLPSCWSPNAICWKDWSHSYFEDICTSGFIKKHVSFKKFRAYLSIILPNGEYFSFL